MPIKRQQHLENPEAYERRKAKQRETYAANAEVRAAKQAYVKQWAAANPDARREILMRFRESDKYKAVQDRFRASAKGKALAVRGARLRRVREKPPTEFDRWVLAEAKKLAKLRTQMLGIPWQVDHVVALSRGGESIASNLQVVPKVWNQAKHNRHAERFIGA